MSLVLRRTLHFIVKVEQVNPERHQIGLHAIFPLGRLSRRKLRRLRKATWRVGISPEPCCRTVGKRMPLCVC